MAQDDKKCDYVFNKDIVDNDSPYLIKDCPTCLRNKDKTCPLGIWKTPEELLDE